MILQFRGGRQRRHAAGLRENIWRRRVEIFSRPPPPYLLTYLLTWPGPGPGSFIETCAQKIKVTDPKNATGVCMLFKVIAVVYVCDMSLTFFRFVRENSGL